MNLFDDLKDNDTAPGILPSQDIKELVRRGNIAGSLQVSEGQIQPASIDLRLGPVAHRVRASFLPGESGVMESKIKQLEVGRYDLTVPRGVLLEPQSVFVVPLVETLRLPTNVFGIANPKSTTGRLDILTRLITECGNEFDRVSRGYKGKLFVEIVSRTFPVYVKAGMKLNQLRFVRGSPAPTGDATLEELDKRGQIVYDDDSRETAKKINRGLNITIDLEGNGSDIVAYQAKRHAPPIELEKVNHYDMDDFWETIRRPASGRHILEPSGFYLLASKRKVRVPPDRAAEMVPYDPTMGEFRLHYAGFFDPGFGYGSNGEIPGTKAVLEVRAYEIPILIEHGQLVGKLNYFRLSKPPEKVYGLSIGSSYQQQGLTPSKQFRAPSTREREPHPILMSDAIALTT